MRLHAVYQIKLGRKSEKLEQLYNISRKSICNWVHSYNASGVEEFKDKPVADDRLDFRRSNGQN